MLFAHVLVATHTVHAGVMGIVCGSLHALGPDHLATLAAFSTLLDPWAAARVGAAWGLGHATGIVAVAFLVFVAGRIPGVAVHFESWEHSGDYVIGISMVLVALYFIFREERYIVVDDAGHVHVKGCGCSEPKGLEEARCQPKECQSAECGSKLCGSYTGCSDANCDAKQGCDDVAPEVQETTPLLATSSTTQGRDVKGALVGLVQGMCCPMGLIQLGYLAGKNAADTAVFIAVTLTVSVCGTAAVAAAWAALTRSSLTKSVSPRLLYRLSCGLALAFGILWIGASYLNVLDKINYAEPGMEEMHMP